MKESLEINLLHARHIKWHKRASTAVTTYLRLTFAYLLQLNTLPSKSFLLCLSVLLSWKWLPRNVYLKLNVLTSQPVFTSRVCPLTPQYTSRLKTLFFWDTVSLCGFYCSGTHWVEQAILELKDLFVCPPGIQDVYLSAWLDYTHLTFDSATQTYDLVCYTLWKLNIIKAYLVKASKGRSQHKILYLYAKHIVLSSSDIRKMNYLFSFFHKTPTKLFLKTSNNFSKEMWVSSYYHNLII